MSRDDTPAAIRDTARAVRAALDRGQPVLVGCDRSLEGVLAATGITYLAHARDGEVRLAGSTNLQPQLGEVVVRAPKDTLDSTVDFARRVLEGFGKRVSGNCRRLREGGCPETCSAACVQRMVYVTASDDPSMPQVAYQYLRLGFAIGPQVRQMIADKRVAAFDGLARTVASECEHTRQFVRFSHMSDGSFVASFSPKADTIPLVASHFAARMGTERFCLVDPTHLVAAFHEEGSPRCSVLRLDKSLASQIASRRDLADDERYVRTMWQHFYHGTTTPGRDRSQRGYDLRTKWMPQRFWSSLSELGPEEMGLAVPERYAGQSSNPRAALQGQQADYEQSLPATE